MDDHPLSFSQQALWFLCTLESESPFYNMSRAYRLHGDIRLDALRAALREMLEQHAILRSRIVELDGKPQLVVDPANVLPALEEVDLTTFAATERDLALTAITQRHARQIFDLATDPPIRTMLVRTGEQEYVLQATFHHVAADRWSVDQVFGPQLASRYAAHVGGGPTPAPAEHQYWDFACWQRDRLTPERTAELLGYWRKTLVGVPAVVDIRGDRERPATQTFAGAAYSFSLSSGLLDSVRTLSKNARATDFMTFLTAFGWLMSSLAGENDIIIGVPTMNPGRFVFPDVIGMFVNTLPMRIELTGDPNVQAAVRRVRAAALGAMANRELPFEKIVEDLDLDRELGRNPLIQLLFQMNEELPADELDPAGVFHSTLPADSGITRFDLELHLWLNREGAVDCRFVYATDLYDEPTIAEFARQFEKVLAAMVADAQAPVSALPVAGAVPAANARHRVQVATDRTALASATVSLTAAEQLVVQVWEEVLEFAGFEPDDNFFRVGGSSLRAARVAARLRQMLGEDVPLRLLFEHRTVRELAAALPAFASERHDTMVVPARPLNPPLSFAQQRLWFVDQLVPGSTAYIIDVGYWLEGDLDVSALRAALSEVVRRHEALRTTFPVDAAGRPWQYVSAAREIELPIVDVPDATQVAEIARKRIRGGLPLDTGPLLRATLFRVRPDLHALVLNAHHTIFDGVSRALLAHELAALYTHGSAAQLPELPLQYADFAGWQRQGADSGRLESALAYWRRQLAGVTSLDLPTDRPHPAVPSFAGGRYDFDLSADLTTAVDGLGETPYLVLVAALATLLGRYSGHPDVCVSTAVDTRGRPEFEQLIGFFADTLVVRVDLAGDPSFRDVLGRVRDTYLAAHEHRDLPFERLVGALGLPQDVSRTPLTQVSVVFHDTDTPAVDLGEVRAEPFPLEDPSTRFELELHLRIADGRLRGLMTYSTDLFDEATIERLVRHLRTLLAGVANAPDRRLADVDLMDSGERHDVLVSAQGASVDLGAPAGLHELVEEQARHTPDAPAIVFGDEVMSYAELTDRAGRLAARLRERGVRAGRIVGIHLARSPELVVSMLAVLKSGAAFLLLNPDDPADRVARLVEDAAPVLVVSMTPMRASADVVSPHDLAAEAMPPVLVDPAGTAYVVYTSGSTGQPNGAVNTHAGIVNYLRWHRTALPLGPGDAVLGKTPTTFDACIWESFWPLTTGARLVLARPEGHLDPGYLMRMIRDHGITMAFFVPSLLRIFLREPGVRELCAGLRWVVSAGETLPPDLAEQAQQLLGAELWNFYGPAEAAVGATAWRCEPGSVGAAVPVGRPVANTQAYVLDETGRLQPVGVPGELYLGGVGVGSGYLRRPELTERRFVPDPYQSGRRLFRTGDRARLRPDGALEILGRRDDQVKLRGARMELGEIEAALVSHPGVAAAAVALHADRLVGYVVPAGREIPDDLAGYLRDGLPLAMVPAAYVPVLELPLSRNGKLDRRALPAPPAHSGRTVAPRNDQERRLAELFAAVLGAASVAVTDDFFALGGHSILAAQLVTRVEQAFGRRPALAAFFREPTVQGMSGALDADADGEEFVRLRPGAPDQPPLLLFAPVGGGLGVYQDLVRQLPAGPAVFGFRMPGLDGSEPLTDVTELARRHAATIQRMPVAAPFRLAGWSFGGVVAHAVAAELANAGLLPSSLLMIDSYPTVDEMTVVQKRAAFAATVKREHVEPVPEEQASRLWRVYAASAEASERHVPPVYPGSAVLIRPTGSGLPDNAWSPFVRGEITVRTPVADHYSCLLTPETLTELTG